MKIYYITHPKVIVDSKLDSAEWRISEDGYKQIETLLKERWISDVEKIYTSDERKTRDMAEILSERLGVQKKIIKGLGGADRNSGKTGFLSREDFQKAAEDFYKFPNKSVLNAWDTAKSVQRRNIDEIKKLISENTNSKNIAVIGHGDAGTLLMCYFLSEPISKKYDQSQLGSYFVYDTEERKIIQNWKPII